MDLGAILEQYFRRSSTDNKEALFCLLVSHLDASHEPILCDLVGHALHYGFHPFPNIAAETGEGTAELASQSVQNCLLIALQKPARFYQKFLTPVIRGHESSCKLSVVDLPEWTQGFVTKFYSNDSSDSLGTFTEKFVEELLEHIRIEVDRFSETVKKTPGVSIVALDNLTGFADLGVSPRQLERLLTRLRHVASGIVRIFVGCHVGRAFEDTIASELDPAFLHHLSLCRSRAALILDVRPLATGYTTSLDGEISVQETTNGIITRSKTIRTFHYKCDGRRVLCYTPGTSKLIT
ncbi:hypothetical protein EG68_02993 [Paragonimus skrjabini miyazakii]|uniref:Elongator complex protein 6 n=1 Tax=Paragonimus skrjabini miyazakii TaxID=59628 RepID=A0A8S9YX23_9TREM|nr:hypothetical protein EG68_02993 [Paragonimus skrjabini miyazakii]